MARPDELRSAVRRSAQRSGGFTLFAVVAIVSSVFAGPSLADVIEVSADGSVTVLAGPAPRATETAPSAAPEADTAAVLQRAAAHADLSPDLVSAVAWVESRYQPHARSSAGAMGIMQLMPATAADLGVDPHNVEQNALGGARYLRRMLDDFDGDLVLALAAYNAGPAAVRRHGGIPPYPETQRYVASVLSFLSDRAPQEGSPP